MSCACIKKREFDITVSHRGCEYMILEDNSTWVGKDKPTNYDVTLKALSRGSEVTLTLNVDRKNYFSTKDLFNSQELMCIPDDVYCISTETCGYKLNINRAYICNTELKLNDLIYKFAETMDSEQRRIIFDLQMSITSIKINAEKGNLDIARRLLQTVKDKLKAYHCDNC